MMGLIRYYRFSFRALCARLCLLVAFLSLAAPAIGQQQSLDSLVQKFNAYRTQATTEKVYAHIDQEVCLTGETMWFKLYLFNATTHEPSKLSKVAYVEVLDNVNHALLQTKVALNNGVGSGSLFLPASLTSGNYVLRVYTAWMKNFSPSLYFHKQITVINPFRRLEVEKKVTAPLRMEVQFFPEGGALVNGVASRVGYRIVNRGDSSSRPSIHFIQGDTTVLKPDLNGLGAFSVTPRSDRPMLAYVVDREGNRQELKMPVAADAGYSLSVKDTANESIAIRVRKVNIPDDENHVFLVIHARNVISVARVQRLRGGSATVVLPRNTLGEGISHITVFDAAMRAVCERLYFNSVRRVLSITATPTQREYGVRRKVSLDLTVLEAGGMAASSNLSVAVYRRDSLRRNDSHALNSLWLDSDLQDVPALPGDFLINLTPEKRILIDHIMLTHGWRRFSWSDIAAGKKPSVAFVPELRGHIIRGIVRDTEGNPESGKMTYLSAPGTNIQVYGSISNKRGEVQYEMKDFSGSRRIAVQTNLSRDSTSKITIVSPFSDQFAPPAITPFALNPNVSATLATRSFSMQVQDIYYQDKGAQTRSVDIDTTAFYGKADATYFLDDYTRFPVMEEVMREYVPGVLVRKRRDGFHFINLDLVNKGVFSEDPFIMLDGLPLFDADEIMSYSPLKVKKLEVFTRRYYMGVLSLPGIVSYTTYAGDLSGFNINPKCLVIDYEGLQMQREYYTPKYESSKQRDSRMPDQRDRLFWAPSVVTDSQGKQHLEFFTSDVTGEYEVLVEGMSNRGAVGGAKSKFVVVSLND